jgi:hypothetical protein
MKKKSLIENLKTTRKANVISQAAKNQGNSTRKGRSARTKMAVAGSGGPKA